MKAALAAGQPTVSVNTKKQEKRSDRRLHESWARVSPQGRSAQGAGARLLTAKLGRPAPYDIADNAGWVNVGLDPDTASFAVNSIRPWWEDTHRAAIPTPAS
jgi:Rhodopirellula transposase DDE domain